MDIMRVRELMDKMKGAATKAEELSEQISEVQKLYDDLYDNIRIPDVQVAPSMVKKLPGRIKEALVQTKELNLKAQLSLCLMPQHLEVLMCAHSELNRKKAR